MAIKTDGELARLFGRDAGDKRFQIWLWHYLAFIKNFSDLINKSPYDVDALGGVFFFHPGLKGEVASLKAGQLLPMNYFSWMRDDLRQNKWIWKNLFGMERLKLFLPQIHSSLLDRERIVLAIDFIDMPGPEKIEAVRQLERRWNAWVSADDVCDWFKKKDSIERCEFFWRWLKRNGVYLSQDYPEFKNYQDILIYFDNFPLTYSDKILRIEKVKKAWSQSQYRKNQEGKKQCNLMLAENVVLLLDKLSAKHGLSKTEIVELLIRDEADKGIYISQRLDRRRQILDGGL